MNTRISIYSLALSWICTLSLSAMEKEKTDFKKQSPDISQAELMERLQKQLDTILPSPSHFSQHTQEEKTDLKKPQPDISQAELMELLRKQLDTILPSPSHFSQHSEHQTKK